MELNEEYQTIRGVLRTYKLTSYHENLYPIIKKEEQQRSLTTPPTELSTTLLAHNQGPYRPPRPDTRDRPFYTHYKTSGYTVESCYQVLSRKTCI